MRKEINAHTTKKHWDFLLRTSINRTNNKPLQAVWAIKQKWLPGTGAISKYKDHLLNVHGGQQEEGMNY